MKKQSYLLVLVLALTSILISACGGSAAISAPNATSGGGSKPQASPVEFTGVIEAINGDQWSINGQTITVDPAVVRNGPFNVGDTVKVEVNVQSDGSVVVNRVEAPGIDDNSNDANSNDANSNDGNSNDANSNDVNSNDANSNDANSNDANSNDVNSNDDNSNGANSNDDNGSDSNSNGDDSNDSNGNDDKSNDDKSNDDKSNDDKSNDDSDND